MIVTQVDYARTGCVSVAARSHPDRNNKVRSSRPIAQDVWSRAQWPKRWDKRRRPPLPKVFPHPELSFKFNWIISSLAIRGEKLACLDFDALSSPPQCGVERETIMLAGYHFPFLREV